MSTLDVVADVLRESAPRALKAREIAFLARTRLPTASRTPETVISRDLALDIKRHGGASRFLRTAPGEFLLKGALPTALYNEIEPRPAQWTRNLIAAGELAPGVVDERSIRDLTPADVGSYRQFHTFSGIGVWGRALRDAGWPDAISVWSGSAPCQPWSSAGQRQGLDDDRHLWPDWFRLIRACRPAVIFGEQVASKDGLTWLDLVFDDLEGADYTVRALDSSAAGHGAPHLRQRLYFVAVARERGREIISAPWLHDHGQPWNDAARRCAADVGRVACAVPDASKHGWNEGHLDGARLAVDDCAVTSGAVSDAASARPLDPEDAHADHGDAGICAQAGVWGCAGHLEFERSGAVDARALSDAERLVLDARRLAEPHGWTAFEPGRYGALDGEPGPLGDAGRDGAWEHARELHGDEAQREEWSEVGDHASLAAGAAHGTGTGSRCVGVVDTDVVGREGHAAEDAQAWDRRSSNGSRGCGPDVGDAWRGAVGGFWEHANWIYCRPAPGHEDGRFRPVEPILVKMVDGAPTVLGPLCAEEVEDVPQALIDVRIVLSALWPDLGAFTAFERVQGAEVLRTALHVPARAEPVDPAHLAGGDVLYPLRSFQARTPVQPIHLDALVRLLVASRVHAQLRSDQRTLDALHALLAACDATLLVTCSEREAPAFWEALPVAAKEALLRGLGQFRRASVAPLAYTVKGTGRSDRLRGYGNAIALPQAVAFIEATIASFVDTFHAAQLERSS